MLVGVHEEGKEHIKLFYMYYILAKSFATMTIYGSS